MRPAFLYAVAALVATLLVPTSAVLVTVGAHDDEVGKERGYCRERESPPDLECFDQSEERTRGDRSLGRRLGKKTLVGSH